MCEKERDIVMREKHAETCWERNERDNDSVQRTSGENERDNYDRRVVV